jgi:hypothetical protein
MNRITALLVVSIPIMAFAQAPKGERAPSGWSIAIEGSGIPGGQNASDYAAEIDRKVTHGGQGAMSLRSVVAAPTGFRAATQCVKADLYRGKRVRLAGYLRTRDVADWSGLWLRVDGPARALAFDNMEPRAVKGTTDWTRYEVVLDVPEAAVRLAFGPVLRGAGQVWADDLTLDVVDPKAIKSTQPPGYVLNPAEHASNLDFETIGTASSIPGWNIHAHSSDSYSQRIAEGGAHGGRTFLEVKSTQQGSPTFFSASQGIVAGPYKGKRVRFRAFLKTGDVAEEASVAMVTGTGQSSYYATTRGRGAKGSTDWQPQEIVLDVPTDAEELGVSVILRGRGTLGVDDASLEVVDPAKVPVTPESEVAKANREKRLREEPEAIAKLPDRPEDMDFER